MENCYENQLFRPRIKVADINEYLTCFYDGIDLEGYPEWLKSNMDMECGICSYAIHRGGKAILFDTMLYKEHILWIDDYLKKRNLEVIAVINSHPDPDHVAGNYLYNDKSIISTKNTRILMYSLKSAITSGELWKIWGDPNFPGVPPVVLPNITFEGRLTMHLDDLEIELQENPVHQVGHLIVWFPKDKIMLCGDALDDPFPFVNYGNEALLPLQLDIYKKMINMDICSIFTSHGRFEVIEQGGYPKELIAANLEYIRNLLLKLKEEDYLEGSVEDFMGEYAERDYIDLRHPYRALHDYNKSLLYEYYKDKPKPEIQD